LAVNSEATRDRILRSVGDQRNALIDTLRQLIQAPSITGAEGPLPRLEVIERYESYAETEDNPFLTLMREMNEQVTGANLPLVGMNGGCDAYVRHVYGHSPTVIFGPSGDNAHPP